MEWFFNRSFSGHWLFGKLGSNGTPLRYFLFQLFQYIQNQEIHKNY